MEWAPRQPMSLPSWPELRNALAAAARALEVGRRLAQTWATFPYLGATGPGLRSSLVAASRALESRVVRSRGYGATLARV